MTCFCRRSFYILHALFCLFFTAKGFVHAIPAKSLAFKCRQHEYNPSHSSSSFSELMKTRGGMAIEMNRRPSLVHLSVNDVLDYFIEKPVLQDISCAVFSAVAALIWVRIWEYLASQGKIDSKVSRKIIHCGSGPLFLLVWPFFSTQPLARYFAAVVPTIQIFRLWRAGASDVSEENTLVKAISRSGAAKEVLGGPFIYCLVLLGATVAFWRDSLVGVMAVCQMAAGDGMADIVGRKFGTVKWPWSEDKSIAGTVGFITGGFLVTVGVIIWLHFTGSLSMAVSGPLLQQVALITLISAAVEVIPFAGDDNFSVPLSAGLLAYLLCSG